MTNPNGASTPNYNRINEWPLQFRTWLDRALVFIVFFVFILPRYAAQSNASKALEIEIAGVEDEVTKRRQIIRHAKVAVKQIERYARMYSPNGP